MSLLDAVRYRLVVHLCRTKSRTQVGAPNDGELVQTLLAPSADKKLSKSAAVAAVGLLVQWVGGWRAGERMASRTTV